MQQLYLWIKSNYEWFFSGLGVFLLALLISVRRVRSRISTKGDFSPGNIEGDYRVDIDINGSANKGKD